MGICFSAFSTPTPPEHYRVVAVEASIGHSLLVAALPMPAPSLKVAGV